MKPEQEQRVEIKPEPAHVTAAACERPRPATERRKETTDPFEAILEAYAQDPERWDGLE